MKDDRIKEVLEKIDEIELLGRQIIKLKNLISDVERFSSDYYDIGVSPPTTKSVGEKLHRFRVTEKQFKTYILEALKQFLLVVVAKAERAYKD